MPKKRSKIEDIVNRAAAHIAEGVAAAVEEAEAALADLALDVDQRLKKISAGLKGGGRAIRQEVEGAVKVVKGRVVDSRPVPEKKSGKN